MRGCGGVKQNLMSQPIFTDEMQQSDEGQDELDSEPEHLCSVLQ